MDGMNKLTALGGTAGASGVCRQGSGAARLAEGSASSRYMTPAANAATCLA